MAAGRQWDCITHSGSGLMNMSEKTKMTIAEGLQELKRIKKLVDTKYSLITKYCSKVAVLPDEVEGQEAEVKKIDQSVRDLLDRYANIKMAINTSNLKTSFEFKGKTYSIALAILYKQYLKDEYTKLLSSYTDLNAQRQLSGMQIAGIPEEKMEVAMLVPKLYFDPKEVQKEKDDLLELIAHIDGKIDASNHATTVSI